MNIKHLKRFVLVVDNGFNFSKAAKILGISQPALSKQINNLEKDLTVELLVRNGKWITGVTTHGEVIYKVAEKMIYLEKAAMTYIETGVMRFVKPSDDECAVIENIEQVVKAYRKKHKLIKSKGDSDE